MVTCTLLARRFSTTFVDSSVNIIGQLLSSLIQNLPENLVTMRSRKGFHDRCNTVMLKFNKNLVQRLTLSRQGRSRTSSSVLWVLEVAVGSIPWPSRILGQTHMWLRWWLASLMMLTMPPFQGRPWREMCRLQITSRQLLSKDTGMNPPPVSMKVKKTVNLPGAVVSTAV